MPKQAHEKQVPSKLSSLEKWNLDRKEREMNIHSQYAFC